MSHKLVKGRIKNEKVTLAFLVVSMLPILGWSEANVCGQIGRKYGRREAAKVHSDAIRALKGKGNKDARKEANAAFKQKLSEIKLAAKAEREAAGCSEQE